MDKESKNYSNAVKKWKRVAAMLQGWDSIPDDIENIYRKEIYTTDGFCREFAIGLDCRYCPLYKGKHCASYLAFSRGTTVSNIYFALCKDRDLKLAIKLAKTLLHVTWAHKRKFRWMRKGIATNVYTNPV